LLGWYESQLCYIFQLSGCRSLEGGIRLSRIRFARRHRLYTIQSDYCRVCPHLL
jgi:hypothetical protein